MKLSLYFSCHHFPNFRCATPDLFHISISWTCSAWLEPRDYLLILSLDIFLGSSKQMVSGGPRHFAQVLQGLTLSFSSVLLANADYTYPMVATECADAGPAPLFLSLCWLPGGKCIPRAAGVHAGVGPASASQLELVISAQASLKLPEILLSQPADCLDNQ